MTPRIGKGVVQFNPPLTEVRRTMQKPVSPEQQAAQDRMASIKAGARPVGGVPRVRIPPLDADPLPGGGSMSAQADALRDPTNPLSPAYSPELAAMASKERAIGQGPFDLLPDSATEDPGFIPGVGSRVSANQPNVRQPQPRPKDQVLRPETVQDLEKLSALQKTAEQMQQSETQKEEAQAAEVEKQLIEDAAKQAAELGSLMSEGDWNILNNPARRKEIESRLKPLKIEDILVYGEVRQEVPVIPDKCVFFFRSSSGAEDLAVKRMMFGEQGGDRYMLDKFSLMNLALGVVSINGMQLPSHLDDKKKFDEKLFLKKFDMLMRFPIQLLADMGVQYMWFDHRVRQLFTKSTEVLKNS